MLIPWKRGNIGCTYMILPSTKHHMLILLQLLLDFRKKSVQWQIITFYKLCNFNYRNLVMVGEFKDYQCIAQCYLDKD